MGQTWQDYAEAADYAPPSGRNIYAIGGMRHTTADGRILGTFTEQAPAGQTNKVWFFQVQARTK